MGSSDAAAVARLTSADLSDCLALSAEAGWNQVEADWRIFLEHGIVWGIRVDGHVAASAALLPYPPATAWISMVLTAGAFRGRGFAKRLMREAVDESARRGLVPQLDATPAGQPVYEKLGFGPVIRLTRWRRTGSGKALHAATPSSESSNEEEMYRLDAEALGFDRRWLLRALLRRGPGVLHAGGFALSRNGRMADQVGPVAARSAVEASAAVDGVLRALGPERAVFVDASDDQPEFLDFLNARGFQPERSFLRMAKGGPPHPDTGILHAAAGPEFG